MTVELFLERLRQRGERVTMQRRQVIDVMLEHGEHLAVQDIQARLQERGVELTLPTVYRILQWLKGVGAVCQTDLGQDRIVYQLVGERPHHHLVCLHCGTVLDADDQLFADLRERLRRDYGFEPRIDHMAVFGVCEACRKAEREG
ncbi:MAG TPA: Fur family transcriptional regulator [Aggregatilineaceae bacterium]|nr:Fur family transcriptional regulator [Aggregatilineaceae bacterium]